MARSMPGALRQIRATHAPSWPAKGAGSIDPRDAAFDRLSGLAAALTHLTSAVFTSSIHYMTSEALRQSISFQLNPASGVPAYLQLAQQVRQALRMGVLEIGDKLPTVKEVVAEVAVNPNTVMKAYWQLEHEGLVEGRQGVGTFAARRPAGPPPGTQLRLARSLQRWVQTARGAGLDDEAIESLLRSTLSSSQAERIA
jgi:GntR family transcriptional regulator